jgi:hypothetical protein
MCQECSEHANEQEQDNRKRMWMGFALMIVAVIAGNLISKKL